ncbi:hypothetical protein KUV50_00110 [Membranicola marinus]|uniref:Uncharacterized protein n=1 Tax=Membranihabitans marinus TaxID=1227546 RepID=A0A953L9C6_9BACT|nr:hypothetical protein [Membranihabitans marinus]MBY5956516.1 hypothetical protein [Membranihabitans marinus]
MISSILMTCFIGFSLYYFTSERATVTYQSVTIDWIGQHHEESRILSTVFLTASALLSMFQWGLLGGLFSFCVILMTVGSLTFLLQPLQVLSPVTLMLIGVFIILLEVII